MLIRKAKKEDAKEIQEVFRDSYHKDYGAAGEYYSTEEFVDPNYATDGGPYGSQKEFVESLAKQLPERLKGREAYVAVHNNKIVGYIIGEKQNKKYWIYDIIVKKKYQNKKIGKTLVNKLIKNKCNVFCWVNAKNPALKFWKKFGFETVVKEILLRRP